MKYLCIIYSTDNRFLSVAFDLMSMSIMCKFHDLQDGNNSIKSCTIKIGVKEGNCNFSFFNAGHSLSKVVIIDLSLQFSSSRQYCFSVFGNNGTYSAIIEGIFYPGTHEGNEVIMIACMHAFM